MSYSKIDGLYLIVEDGKSSRPEFYKLVAEVNGYYLAQSAHVGSGESAITAVHSPLVHIETGERDGHHFYVDQEDACEDYNHMLNRSSTA